MSARGAYCWLLPQWQVWRIKKRMHIHVYNVLLYVHSPYNRCSCIYFTAQCLADTLTVWLAFLTPCPAPHQADAISHCVDYSSLPGAGEHGAGGFEELECFHTYAGVGTRLDEWREGWKRENTWEVWGFAPDREKVTLV